jgi:Stage II sporulation protein E (SpoIIE)
MVFGTSLRLEKQSTPLTALSLIFNYFNPRSLEYACPMLPRHKRIQCLGILVLCAALSGAARAGEAVGTAQVPTLKFDALGKGSAQIDGPWQFQLGDDPTWASPIIDDSHWEQLTTDQPWGAQGHYAVEGFGWYRRHIALTPAPDASPDFAMLIPGVDDAYEIYWNGELVGHNGKMPPNPDWYPSQPPQTYGLGPIRSGVLAIRVWKSPLASEDPGELGGFEAVPEIGSPQAIAARKAAIDFQWLRSRQFTFGLTSLYALVGLFSLLAWLRDRKQWLLFCMAGYSLTPILGQILTGFRIPWSAGIAGGVLEPVLMIQDISLWYLLLWILKLNDDRALVRLTRWISLTFAVTFFLDGVVGMVWGQFPAHFLQITDAILTALFTPLEIYPLILVIAAIWKRNRLDSARWIVAICAFLTEMSFVIRNAALQGIRYTHWTMGNKLTAPLFTLNGNSITPRNVGDTLLLLSIVYAVYRYSIENRRQQAALEQEFKNAREVQQILVPEALPSLPGFAVTSAYRPAQEVGGDFFQIIPLDNGSTLVILGDVSGKGLKAAMAVSLIVGAARMVADYTSSPAEILAGLNRRLHGRLQGGFATAIALRLDRDGTCAISSAGHPAPFFNQHEMILPGALPLGIEPNADYEETTLNLRVGDHFALYTDGLLEARSQTGELYSFERLETLFATNPNAAQATQAAVNFGQDDDITVLTLTRLATAEESSASHSAPTLVPV